MLYSGIIQWILFFLSLSLTSLKITKTTLPCWSQRERRRMFSIRVSCLGDRSIDLRDEMQTLGVVWRQSEQTSGRAQWGVSSSNSAPGPQKHCSILWHCLALCAVIPAGTRWYFWTSYQHTHTLSEKKKGGVGLVGGEGRRGARDEWIEKQGGPGTWELALLTFRSLLPWLPFSSPPASHAHMRGC